MKLKGKSIRSFIGAKDFTMSSKFYTDLEFNEIIISKNLFHFHVERFGFYLQDAYLKDCIDNTTVFFEVANLE